jgi:hypothetical protein
VTKQGALASLYPSFSMTVVGWDGSQRCLAIVSSHG